MRGMKAQAGQVYRQAAAAAWQQAALQAQARCSGVLHAIQRQSRAALSSAVVHVNATPACTRRRSCGENHPQKRRLSVAPQYTCCATRTTRQYVQRNERATNKTPCHVVPQASNVLPWRAKSAGEWRRTGETQHAPYENWRREMQKSKPAAGTSKKVQTSRRTNSNAPAKPPARMSSTPVLVMFADEGYATARITHQWCRKNRAGDRHHAPRRSRTI